MREIRKWSGVTELKGGETGRKRLDRFVCRIIDGKDVHECFSEVRQDFGDLGRGGVPQPSGSNAKCIRLVRLTEDQGTTEVPPDEYGRHLVNRPKGSANASCSSDKQGREQARQVVARRRVIRVRAARQKLQVIHPPKVHPGKQFGGRYPCAFGVVAGMGVLVTVGSHRFVQRGCCPVWH